jgi:hypothetical protein
MSMPITAREISDHWPAAARKTRDHADDTYRVVDATHLASLIKDGVHPEAAIYKATTAMYFVRSTSQRTHVVCLYMGRAFYGWAGGYGYDRAAAAAAGMPIANGLVSTDHSGLRNSQLKDSRGYALTALMVTSGGYLPDGYFTI